MKRILLVLAITYMLSGCAGQAPIDSQAVMPGHLLGLTTAELVAIKGAPGAVAVLPGGDSVWTYKISMTAQDTGPQVLSWIETTSFMIDGTGKVKSYTTAVE